MNNSAMDDEWRSLKADIERSVKLQPSQIQLGEQAFTWYRVADPDQLLEAALTSNQPPEEVDPFWAATWRRGQRPRQIFRHDRRA